MAILQTRKRQRADEDLQETPRRDQAAPDNSSAKSANPPALDRPTAWHYPSEFWHRLSTIPLIRSALEELNRRNRAQPAFPPPSPSPTELARDLARSARHGGPDLRDLRGYHAPVARHHENDGAMGSSPEARAEQPNPPIRPLSPNQGRPRAKSPQPIIVHSNSIWPTMVFIQPGTLKSPTCPPSTQYSRNQDRHYRPLSSLIAYSRPSAKPMRRPGTKTM